MSILDALPGIAANAFGGLFRDAILSIPGAQTSDGRGGYTSGPAATAACKAIVEGYDEFRRAAAQIPDTDRKVTVLGATLPAGVTPSAGGRITVEGRAWTIVGINRDPAGATFELQVR